MTVYIVQCKLIHGMFLLLTRCICYDVVFALTVGVTGLTISRVVYMRQLHCE